jgi:ABC-type sugar transport system ATPase subunit
MDAAEAPLIELRGVGKAFGAVEALRNVSLELRRGDVVGLVGDNGAGKSTLVKMLAGAHDPTSGAILLEGAPAVLSPPAEAQRLGIETVYQDLSLIGSFTATENFFLGRELCWGRGPRLVRWMRRRAMAEAALKGLEELRIEIPRVRTQPVDRMSGGQRQLTAIARGAFWGSKLLLLDEPTAALGVRESREVLDLIARLSTRGVTILMVKVADMASRDTTMDEVVGFITGARGERELGRSP